jgi:hypothetical protein
MRCLWLLCLCLLAGCERGPRVAIEVDVDQMHRMLQQPAWTAEQWSEFCEQTSPGEGAQHCGMAVIVDCPPDCGVYALLQHDPFLRRIQ